VRDVDAHHTHPFTNERIAAERTGFYATAAVKNADTASGAEGMA
jgi:hypothetical protein